MIKRIFVDMDGVLCDLVSATCLEHGFSLLEHADGSLHIADDCGSVPMHPWPKGSYDIASVLGIKATEFWSALDNPGFWENLKPYPWLSELMQLAEIHVGYENVCLLTSPSLSPYCANEKIAWVEEYLPQYRKQMLIGSAKHFCARRDAVLIDDSSTNVMQFLGADGDTILFPRWWNSNYASSADPMKFVTRSLEARS